mmetsp:Transcript_6086/g.9853  ORF Transcript_6086/g.9853 Transcript_6086/m.9853 type:complete len:247 (-) Transcript_6086:394-1134(-)
MLHSSLEGWRFRKNLTRDGEFALTWSAFCFGGTNPRKNAVWIPDAPACKQICFCDILFSSVGVPSAAASQIRKSFCPQELGTVHPCAITFEGRYTPRIPRGTPRGPLSRACNKPNFAPLLRVSLVPGNGPSSSAGSPRNTATDKFKVSCCIKLKSFAETSFFGSSKKRTDVIGASTACKRSGNLSRNSASKSCACRLCFSKLSALRSKCKGTPGKALRKSAAVLNGCGSQSCKSIKSSAATPMDVK